MTNIDVSAAVAQMSQFVIGLTKSDFERAGLGLSKGKGFLQWQLKIWFLWYIIVWVSLEDQEHHNNYKYNHVLYCTQKTYQYF